MSLDCVLLGLLSRPSSGYDLKQWFSRAFHHFWAAEPSQIYRTLGRLEDHGLASVEETPSLKGPPRRVYRRTKAGRAALRAWLRDGPSMSDTRQSQLAQVLFLAELPKDAQRRFLRALLREYEARLEDLLAVAAEVEHHADPARAPSEDEFFRRLTLDAGIQQYQSWIDWIDRAIQHHAAWSATEDEPTRSAQGRD
ncbi:MAG: PadR family transcriptional regulator [Planctomycetota bacterium]